MTLPSSVMLCIYQYVLDEAMKIWEWWCYSQDNTVAVYSQLNRLFNISDLKTSNENFKWTFNEKANTEGWIDQLD